MGTLTDLEEHLAAVIDPASARREPAGIDRQPLKGRWPAHRVFAVAAVSFPVAWSVALVAAGLLDGRAGVLTAAAAAAATFMLMVAAVSTRRSVRQRRATGDRIADFQRARTSIRHWRSQIGSDGMAAAAVALTDDEFEQLCCTTLEFIERESAGGFELVTGRTTGSILSWLCDVLVAVSYNRDAAAGLTSLAVPPLNIATALFQCTPVDLPARERWEMVQEGRRAAAACGSTQPIDCDGAYVRTSDGSLRSTRPLSTCVDWPARWVEYRRLEAAGDAAVEVAAGIYPTMNDTLASIVDTAIAVVAAPAATNS